MTLFSRADHAPLPLENIFNGWPAFLVVSGPSLNELNHAEMNRPGILTLGVNNSPKVFRPNLWTMTDDVHSFIRSIWLDPNILKFVPEGKPRERLFDSDAWKVTNTRVDQCPSVVYFKRNNKFNPATFLTEPTFNWGNHEDNCHCGHVRPDRKTRKADKSKDWSTCPKCGAKDRWGSRSVMLVAVRLLYALGVRTVFLAGCDFKMAEGVSNYAFEQERAPGSVKGNNSTYRMMNLRFQQLRPVFEKAGLKVYNTNAKSGLKAFDYVPYNEAIQFCLKDFPNVETERTAGLYDRKANEKKAERAAPNRLTLETILANVRRAGS